MSSEQKSHDILKEEIEKLGQIISKIEQVIDASVRDLEATILIKEVLEEDLKRRPQTGELEIIVDP